MMAMLSKMNISSRTRAEAGKKSTHMSQRRLAALLICTLLQVSYLIEAPFSSFNSTMMMTYNC
jgi:hypothetical protein